jgi:hypothetical protein
VDLFSIPFTLKGAISSPGFLLSKEIYPIQEGEEKATSPEET